MKLDRPIAILGLDGATWDVIDPLMAQGKLPCLAGLMQRGAYGRMATLPQYTSPSLWATVLTGKLPEKHGVLDFYSATGNHLRAKPIYEILSEDPIGLFQMYASRRKEPSAGFLVPSRIEGPSAAYPAEMAFVIDFGGVGTLRETISLFGQLLRHGVPPWVIGQAGLTTAFKALGLIDKSTWKVQTSMQGQRFRGYIAAHLVKRTQPRFFASLFYVLDSLGHYYWRYWEPSRWADFDQTQVRKNGHVLENAYIEVDKSLGRILRTLPKSTLIAVVSDHGMEAATNDRGGKPLTIHGKAVLESLNLGRQFISELLPPFKCIFRAKPPYWTHDNSVELRHFLVEAELADSTHPFQVDIPDLRSVIVSVQPDVANRLDEILLLPTGNQIPLSQLVFQHDEINGTHSQYGIFVLSGDGIRHGARLADSTLADIVPTLLALSSRAVARDMDGIVIREAIEDDFLARNPIHYVDTYEEADDSRDSPLPGDQDNEAIDARLRDLGYLA